MELKFEVEKYGNHSRTFHTNVTVGSEAIEHYATWMSTSWSDICDKQGTIVADMVTRLLRVYGVDSVFVKPYEVSVHLDTLKHPNVRWNEMIDDVVRNTFEALYSVRHFCKPASYWQPRHCGQTVKMILSGERGEFHTNFEVSQSVIEDFYRPLRTSSDEYLKKIGHNGAQLVSKLMKLPGVTEIFIQPYEVTIHIGKAFSWNEVDNDGKTLEGRVQETFEQVFGRILFGSK